MVGASALVDRSAVLSWIANTLGAREARHAGSIQPLWAGYGELFRIELSGRAVRRAIVKWARPPRDADEPSAARKRESFDVETTFYRRVAARCDETCRVPVLLAARGGGETGEWILVLEDLDASGYDTRVAEAAGAQLEAALAWLASFHARFLGESVDGLWPTGTYWHLGTRLDELAAIDDAALRTIAPRVAARLAAVRYRTLVHGDAKDANFCFGPRGTDVAAVDFQYVGAGCAMSDVAYLLYGRSDEPADGIDRRRLDTYFRHLRRALGRRPDAEAVDIDALEAEWLSLYPMARLDFCRFLAGWRPEAWRRDLAGQRFVRAMLDDMRDTSL
ncbi:MAG: hypothetical protein ABS36_05545 [Acidobacteria bacterium SCN 69-37]|nr:MAG: hypothetical protein ABS36_05545 [Acidobacteria bacterium SCN 69-37]